MNAAMRLDCVVLPIMKQGAKIIFLVSNGSEYQMKTKPEAGSIVLQYVEVETGPDLDQLRFQFQFVTVQNPFKRHVIPMQTTKAVVKWVQARLNLDEGMVLEEVHKDSHSDYGIKVIMPLTDLEMFSNSDNTTGIIESFHTGLALLSSAWSAMSHLTYGNGLVRSQSYFMEETLCPALVRPRPRPGNSAPDINQKGFTVMTVTIL